MDVLESARQAAAVLDGNLGGDQLPSDDVSVHPAQPTPGTMTIATWNVWFDGFARFTRWAALLEEIFGHMPDVVCLQEVTQPFLSILAQSSYVQTNYTTSDAGMLAAKQQPCCLEGYRQYDVLLLVKNGLKVNAWWEIGVPSAMYRRCIGVDVELPCANAGADAAPHKVQVATIHLESTSKGAGYRAKQLDRLALELGKGKAASTTTVLCGDMNMCSSNEVENMRIEARYEDCWPLVHQKKKKNSSAVSLKKEAELARWHAAAGFTEDTSINRMMFQSTLKHKQVRYDRILIQKAADKCAPLPAAAAPRKHFTCKVHGPLCGSKGCKERTAAENAAATAEAAALEGQRVVEAPAGAWHPATIQLLGTAELCTTTPQKGGGYQEAKSKTLSVFPSDHFGVVASFQFR